MERGEILDAIEVELQRRLDPKPRAWHIFGGGYLRPIPRVICADGFSMSVQARSSAYCLPRNSSGPWSAVEIGFPNASVEAFMPYIKGDDDADPTEVVYGYVPLRTVAGVIASHGGFAEPALSKAVQS